MLLSCGLNRFRKFANTALFEAVVILFEAVDVGVAVLEEGVVGLLTFNKKSVACLSNLIACENSTF